MRGFLLWIWVWWNTKEATQDPWKKTQVLPRNPTWQTTPTIKSDTACSKEEEPSLREIKGMFVNIQATMATIVAENKNFRKELADLKRAVDFNDNELRQLKKDHQTTSQMNTMLKKELEKTKEKLNSTKKVLQDQEDETQNLWFSFDSLEQYTRKNSLEFHGIPECLYANAQDVVISVAKKIDVDIEQDDIEIVHKLQRKKSNKPQNSKILQS